VPHQLRRWTKAKGKVLPGLVTRREVEIDLYEGEK
jgi:GH24 family phage-related lysozyme (muramidase)